MKPEKNLLKRILRNKIQFAVSKYQMLNISFKIVLVITMLVFSFIPTFSQISKKQEDCACSKNHKAKVREYFENLEKQNQLIAECESKVRKEYISQNGEIPKITASGCEWTNNGCPVSLVKPKVTEFVRNLRVSGAVEVEIIINKTGKVIYAKAISGNKALYNSAVKAACKSIFSPKIICDKKIMQKKIIHYNFIL